jgi:hypothetical protein
MKRKLHNRAHAAALALSAIAGLASATSALAGGEIPFDEAELYLELNATDEDLGIHSSIDAEAWKMLEIEDPYERTILDVMPSGRLARQGMTQLFFESAEPTFDELPPAAFFRRFPEGRYEISGVSLENEELESTAVLSHVLPGAPANVRVSGIPAATNCDAVLPVVSKPVVITWNAVNTSHPVGKPGAVHVAKYQVFAEQRTAPFSKFSMDLLPSQRRFVVPAELVRQGGDIKFEIQVRDVNLNQTAVESCFTVK